MRLLETQPQRLPTDDRDQHAHQAQISQQDASQARAIEAILDECDYRDNQDLQKT